MNRKQRGNRTERRRKHEEGSRRPRRVLDQDSYPPVKQGHVVPVTYQRMFAVNGRVAVHVPGRQQCVALRVEEAGTRSRMYRRTRPDGTSIDDVEASLASLESRVGPILSDVVGGATLSVESKGALAQFFAVQMVRGPMFFQMTQATAERQVAEAVTIETVSPSTLAAAGGDIDAVRGRAIDVLSDLRFHDMIRASQKVSWVLGCMRWQLLSFRSPALAYCDQPVVVWPLGVDVIDPPPTEPTLAPLNAFEIRAPLAPDLLLLMTWEDLCDEHARRQASDALAADNNALVIAQADKQWMHRPGAEPRMSKRMLRPMSREVNPHYDLAVAQRSTRRATAQRLTDRVLDRSWLNTVKVITEMQAGAVSVGVARGARRRKRSRR